MTTSRDYPTAAAELGVSEEWLREMTPVVPLPHRKFSVDKSGRISDRGRGAVRFFDDDIAAIREMFAVRPVEPATVARPAKPLTRRRTA